MTERDRFELDLADALRAYAEYAPTQVRPTELARQYAAAYPRRRTLFDLWRPVAVPRPAWLLLLLALVGLLFAMLGGMLGVGSQAERDSKVLLPPVGEVYACPTGTDPDAPGPVDQARPPIFGWSPMALDRRAGELVALAGGTSGTQETWTLETWTFDVCTNTWTRMHPDREPPALLGGLVYDVDSDLTIGVHYEDWQDPPLVGNVWAYDLAADTWTEKGVAPTDALRFYDPVSGLVVAAGETGPWDYDVETDTWTPIRPAPGPGYGISAYDASVDRVIEYAGGEGVAETWLFDPRTGSWSRSDAETPVFKMGMWTLPTIVYDEAAERTVIAAHSGWGAYDATADRWEILFDRVAGEVPPAPAVYDPVNRRLIVFGGGIEVSGDLVAFDLMTREWTVLIAPSDGQPAPGAE